MLLKTAVFLTAFGFVGWIVGELFNRPGIATIGAVLIVGVGAMITTDGLATRTGEVTRLNETSNTTTVEDVDYQFSTVKTPANLPLGGITMLFGGLLVLHGLNIEAKQ